MTGMHCGVHLGPVYRVVSCGAFGADRVGSAKSLRLRVVQRAQMITLAPDGMLSQHMNRVYHGNL
ncbi:MAG: hypothetical protein E8D40_05590 [Nitrospira sp.]|nr:MAG: hypothetical protein E8D40_05590 [Nitrospira sp.]